MPPAPPRQRVLLIEDELPLIDVVKGKLEAEQFEVVVARSVEQALASLTSDGQIDAIWLDHFLLGRQTGLDFITDLKKPGSRWRATPIFLVTNTAGSETDAEYLRLGVEKVYSKAAARLDTIVADIKARLKPH